MMQANFWLTICLILQASTLAVKIGISKQSTTSTTTPEPKIFFNVSEASTTLSPLSTTASNNDSSSTALPNETSTIKPQFPPKMTKPTKITTTTSAPITTTTTTQTSRINETSSNRTSTDLAANPASYFYCSCDISPAKCDTNCCCDLDCPKEILKVFDCFSPAQYPELRKAIGDFHYEHGLPSCKINDGWLCVFRTNTRSTPKKEYIFDFDTKNKHKWSHDLIELTDMQEEHERNFYRYGDRLKVINLNAVEIVDFEIPYNFKPPCCQISEPVRHLMTISRDCLVSSLTTAQEFKREFLDFIAISKLLSKPKHQLTDYEDLKDLEIDFEVKICTRRSGAKDLHCRKLDNLNNETDIVDSENLYITETRIQFLHNYTDLMGCQIVFVQEESLASEDSIELWQKYSVSFVAFNETASKHDLEEDNMELPFSGPLGYVQGEPIIVSRYIENIDNEYINASHHVSNYITQPNAAKNTLSLLNQKAGICRRTGYSKDFTISYGISSLTQCTLQIRKESLVPNSLRKANYTEICLRLQQYISEQLFGSHAKPHINDLADLRVSMLGRPKNSSDKWMPLKLQNLDFTPIAGQLVSETKALICRNILISAAYEFHIGTFTEQDIVRQAVVKNSLLILGPRHDLEFALNDHLEVPLTMTVMFYDISHNIGSLIFECGTFNLALVLCLSLII